MATWTRERSPTLRKRGRVPVTITGSRMITSAWAAPTFARLQAVTITRPVPLKDGRGKLTLARPSGPTAIGPE
jgi:hypothetical protein